MVRKRTKRQPQRGQQQTLSFVPDEQLERARRSMANDRWKDAIDAYKRLLKTEPRDEWREGLADAYLGRAAELAGKGMYKEALVFLENLSALGCRRETAALQAACLLLAGKTQQAVQFYLNSKQALPRQQNDRLQSLFAACLIAGEKDLLQAFPEGSPIVKHYGPISEALNAWHAEDDAEARHLLKTIPYRSPYRDLRTILTAVLLQSSDEQAACELFSRIDPNSPFAGVTNVMRLGSLTGPEWLAAVSELGPAAKRYAVASKGVGDKVFALFSRMQNGSRSAKEFFNLLATHAKLFDAEKVRRACIDLLPAYPAGSKIYSKQFGRPSKYDNARTNALFAEQKRNWEDAFHWWRELLNIVGETDTEQNRLRSALIARHLADIQKTHFSPYSETLEELLTFSLRLDPDDKPSYMALLEYYKEMEEDDLYRKCMDQAVKQFPEDSDILMEAIELALERNTFKKAAGYAKTLLRLDPINPRVRGALIRAHLSHARKQIKAKKFHLAEKELNEADAIEREGRSTGIIQIHRGLLAFAQGDVETGETQIEAACRRAGSHLITYLRVVVEAERIGLSTRAVKQYHALLKQSAAAAPDKQEILALIRAIDFYALEDDAPLERALGLVGKYLKKGAGLDYQQDEMAALCSMFERLERYDLLQTYAEHALKKWEDESLFVYFRLYGKTSGNQFLLRPGELTQIKDAMMLAMQRNETDTVKRIHAFLLHNIPLDLPIGFDGFDDFDDDEEW
jgi:hypothetical protein